MTTCIACPTKNKNFAVRNGLCDECREALAAHYEMTDHHNAVPQPYTPRVHRTFANVAAVRSFDEAEEFPRETV